MYMKEKKKKGFILTEVLILCSILVLIISFYTKNVIGDIKKSTLYYINDDILTMNEEEYEFLDKVIENLKSDKDIIESIDTEKFKSINYEFSYLNLSFKISEGNTYMIENNGTSILYRKMDLVLKNNNLIIVPKYYIGYNLNI